MASKAKTAETKVAVLKGKQAEDKVLEYIQRMNRPFGAVDVSANLKGAVPKAATQKIMVALAEKGDLVQKTYGKTTFFVANQANLEDMPSERLAALETDVKRIEDENKALAAELKSVGAELTKLKGTPSDKELTLELDRAAAAVSTLPGYKHRSGPRTQLARRGRVQRARAHLEPLRAGTPLVSAEESAELEGNWTRWRKEWVERRKVFNTLWSLATDALAPQQATELAEDLGLEFDTTEHGGVERGELCGAGSSVLGKRRR
ncbi:TBPIP-domain-containing protein [Trametes elegans]|nr:TBPIP-domain-containing protein [Trametes elegans]